MTNNEMKREPPLVPAENRERRSETGSRREKEVSRCKGPQCKKEKRSRRVRNGRKRGGGRELLQVAAAPVRRDGREGEEP